MLLLLHNNTLKKKLISSFPNKLNYLQSEIKKIAPNYMKTIDETVLDKLKSENILQKTALILRKTILTMDKTKLPSKNLSVQHLIPGEASIPQELYDFYSTLIGGSRQKRKSSLKCIRQVRSYCQDIIYGIHNGQVKTSKHIMLGMTLKSLTSSRKNIGIVNRYGHCISYLSIEELETETTYASIEKSSLCAEKIIKKNWLAYDNFDRFVETTNGKDTLHGTVGIIYQNIELNTSEESEIYEAPVPTNRDDSPQKRKRRRRTFEAIASEEIPYPQKTKMTSNFQLKTDEIDNI